VRGDLGQLHDRAIRGAQRQFAQARHAIDVFAVQHHPNRNDAVALQHGRGRLSEHRRVHSRGNITGGEPEPFGDAECSTPNYSPVGDVLSCIRGHEVAVLSGTDGRQIKSYKLLPYARVNFGARWTPDGRGIVYIRGDKGFANLWVQPLDGSSARQLTDFTIGDIYNFAFSSDGTRLFVARGQEISDAILLRQYR